MYFCENDVSVSIHNRNLHFHAIEMFKASKSVALPIIAEVFGEKNKIWDIIRNTFYDIPSVYRATDSI